MTIRRVSLLLVAVLAAGCVAALAAGCARGGPPLPGDAVSDSGAVALTPARFSTTAPSAPRAGEPIGAIESRLYPAELVMEHQAEIGLSAAQRDAMTKEVEAAQRDLLKVQWELNEQKEKLVAALDPARVDEGQAATIAAALMQREDRIKAIHLAMLVRIKNLLTPEQQAKLRATRDAEGCR
jgi:Spy/CpxP family protein refolding chaperone